MRAAQGRHMAATATCVLLAAAGLRAGADPADVLEPARDAIRHHDYAHATELLRPLAQAGNAEAAYQLAQLLRAAGFAI